MIRNWRAFRGSAAAFFVCFLSFVGFANGQESAEQPTFVVERVNSFQILLRRIEPFEDRRIAAPADRNVLSFFQRFGQTFPNDRLVVSGPSAQIQNLFADFNPSAAAARVVGPGSAAARAGQLPWQVALLLTQPRNSPLQSQMCGGSILSTHWIATAAHCFNGLRRGTFERSVQVAYGNTDLEGKILTVEIEQVYLADEFEHSPPGSLGTRQSYRNDIALLKLKAPIELGETAKPIRYLPSVDTVRLVRDGMPLLVSGWGHIYPVRPGDEPRTPAEIVRSPELLYTTVNAISTENCKNFDRVGGFASDHFICALSSDGGDACTNDSGGPLVSYQHPSREPVLVGIVSFGFGCGQRSIPGMYTNVARHFDWIANTIGASSQAAR